MHHTGIPMFELKTPNNPFIKQGELMKFWPMTKEDMARNTWIDAQIRFWTRREKQAEKFKSIHWTEKHQPTIEDRLNDPEPSPSQRELDEATALRLEFESLEGQLPEHLWLASIRLEKLPLIDRLALGDSRAGEELRRLE